MGGNIAWTLRRPDGVQYRMGRWTNTMPSLITTPAFLDAEPAALQAAIADWEEMRADWEAHGPNGPFALAMTPTYAPYPHGAIPSGYGMVVTDFATHTILSLQGYTDLGAIMPMRQIYGPRQAPSPTIARFDALAAAGRLAEGYLVLNRADSTVGFADQGWAVTQHPHDPQAWEVRIPKGADWAQVTALCDAARADIPPHPQEAALEAYEAQIGTYEDGHPDKARLLEAVAQMRTIHAHQHNPCVVGRVQVDLAPFTLEEFSEDAAGYMGLHTRLRDLGFVLTHAEEEAWQAHIDACIAQEEQEAR